MNIFQTLYTKATKQYSNFGMSNNVQGTIPGFGALTPIYNSTVLPTDSWKLSHNMIVKLPPLVAPAFTRIKAVINSYYCSYPMVWNYWNNFISDRPDDVFLNARNISEYKGRYVEPCIPMHYIALICKIAYGYVCFESDDSSDTSKIFLRFVTPRYNDVQLPLVPTWSLDNGLRSCSYSTDISTFGPKFSSDMSWRFLLHRIDFTYNNNDFSYKFGFKNSESFLIYLCQSCVRNLEALGVPCSLIARNNIGYYCPSYVSGRSDSHEAWCSRFLNALPFMCMSKTWNIYYRNSMVQSPELDYSEVNGSIYLNSDESTSSYGLLDGSPVSDDVSSWTTRYPSKSYNWRIKLNCLPPNIPDPSNYKKVSPLYFDVTSFERMFSVLTGYNLPYLVKESFSAVSSVNINSIIVPQYYNGLLVQKYRNFEDDYYTSATLDPMEGHTSLNVPSTLEELRNVSKLEEFLERNAFARDFYSWMQANFGVSPNSIVNQRPLLLGTKVVPVQIGEQLQTSQTTDSSPLGERAGTAEGYGNGSTCDHSFNEHGFIFSWLSFVLDAQYMQGMPHEFNTHLQMDYPFSDFANLGPELLPTDQLYYGVTYNNRLDHPSFDSRSGVTEIMTNDSSTPSTQNLTLRNLPTGASPSPEYFNIVFGYTPRYTKWKFKSDIVFGQFREEMDYWNTFRKFDQSPLLSHNFVSYENVGYVSNLNRIFAVVNDNADKFWIDVFNNASVRRYLPVVPNPTLN